MPLGKYWYSLSSIKLDYDYYGCVRLKLSIYNYFLEFSIFWDDHFKIDQIKVHIKWIQETKREVRFPK
jgi:hypothetical protein